MKISRFISGSVTEVVQGLLQAQKALALYGVELKTTGGEFGFLELDFDLVVTTRTKNDAGGDIELSVLGVDLKLGSDSSQSTVSRIKFSVQFSIPQEELQKVAQEQQ